jgi:hypothetical protein
MFYFKNLLPILQVAWPPRASVAIKNDDTIALTGNNIF